MKAMHRLWLCLLILTAAVTVTLIASSRESAAAQGQKSASAAAQPGEVERGRYLVEDVAMCGECHSPRDSGGNLDHSRWLQGAPIWIVPVHADTKWAMRAPAIAGLPGFSDSQAETILEKGVGPNGLSIQPPMHIYHINHADSQAIIAYLRSLPSAYPQQ